MPEEINRILTDQISDYLFTTEPAAAENLDREGIPASRIHHVGNVMIDALFRFKERAAATRTPGALGLTPGKYAVLTLHRPSNVDDPATLKGLLGAIARIAREVPVVFPVHPRTRERLDAARAGGGDGSGLRLVDPLPYLDFVGLVMHATCVLTDSGGIQEETTALGIPCLTLRANTERPITVTEGTNRIVGTSPERVTEAWDEIRRGHWPAGRLPELWDGRAAERIVRVLVTLGRR
jgi:UDP-N-acetylglucosamine 2-epimerase (non-hydrolysing)